jgi:hypothetical protein
MTCQVTGGTAMRSPLVAFALSVLLAMLVTAAPNEPGAPKQVFVVNTQDTSVSLVDLEHSLHGFRVARIG